MTTALSTQSTTAALSSYNANDDFVGMRAKDIILPRAQVLQPLSAEVMDNGKPAGAIIDSSTKGILVPAREEGKYIVPIMTWLEWIEWNKDRDCDKKDRVVERSTDPASLLARRADRWETYVDEKGNNKPVVTEYYNFIIAVVDDKMSDYESLYIMGFARSSHTTGKLLLNRLRKTRVAGEDGMPVPAPMFLNRIAIKTTVETKDSNKYWVPVLGEAKQNPDAHLPMLIRIATEAKARRAEIIERNRSEADDSGAGGATAAAVKAEM